MPWRTARCRRGALAAGISPQVRAALGRYPVRELITSSETYPVWVDRTRRAIRQLVRILPALRGREVRRATGEWKSGTFRTAAKRPRGGREDGLRHPLPAARSTRSATRSARDRTTPSTRSRATRARPGRSAPRTAGHDAIHPELGTFEDFEYFVGRAREVGLELVAIDLALQASPDHPVGEGPPEVVQQGAPTARSRTPRTRRRNTRTSTRSTSTTTPKASTPTYCGSSGCGSPRASRCSGSTTRTPSRSTSGSTCSARSARPTRDVLFLSEAFTRRPMMHELAKVGFHQSYTYFTWRQREVELEEYLEELTKETGHLSSRPNFFVNTPDILTAYLQYGDRARSRSGPRSRRRRHRPGACTPGTSCSSTSRCGRAPRSTWTPRSSSSARRLG